VRLIPNSTPPPGLSMIPLKKTSVITVRPTVIVTSPVGYLPVWDVTMK
jgi:hypothetical protein